MRLETYRHPDELIDQRAPYDIAHAQEIAGKCDYESIHAELTEKQILEKHTKTVQEEYSQHFSEKNFVLEQKDWEMLAILDLYDTPTLEHSIRTFDIAHDMMTKTLSGPNDEAIRLEVFIRSEGVSLRQFLRAALFHDIGKVTIPREILNNDFTDPEMDRIILRMFHNGACKDICTTLGLLHGETVSDETILKTIFAEGYRSVDLVPIEEAFPQERYPKLLEIIDQNGYSRKQTLKSILELHEEASASILGDDAIVAELAGHHHNYKGEDSKHKISIAALQISTEIDEYAMMHLISIADKTDALRSDRVYKKSFNEFEIFVELIREASIGRLNKALVYLWISNQYPNVKASAHNNLPALPPKETDSECMEFIETFLAESKRQIETNVKIQ
ncbi:MAG: hypothetical protein PHT88_03100 [Candidatus Moranbacteria bacterium]|nr:hypothetical protein [Candidatus Moranbacteria bacterium]